MVKTEVKHKTWFSDSILLARKAKRHAETAWRRMPNLNTKADYLSAANNYKKAICMAKAQDFNNRIESAPSSSRELFKVVKELEGKPTSALLPDPTKEWCETIQGSIFAKINKHVTNIDAKIALLTASGKSAPPRLSSPHACNSPNFSFRPVTSEEVIKIVSMMKPTSYKGDLVSAKIIKDLLPVLAPIITRLINLSFMTATVPLSLKESWITPLLKKVGLDPFDPLNYRPITHVSFMLKILDTVAHQQVREHLEAHKMLNARQSGFRKGYGTETALLDLKNNLSHIIDNGHPVLLMLLDLSAAFDLVDHGLLVQRLKDCFNFSPQAASWLQSFLSERSARIFLGDIAADPIPLERGVPQGSCLSPTLYNVYTKPLFDLLECHGVGFTNYADDTQIFLPLTGCYESDTLKIQSVFAIIQNWMAVNRLALNDSKTEFLLLGTRTHLARLSPQYSSFNIEGCEINTSTVVKTLGVHLDSNLSMVKHALKVKSSCAYALKLICQIKNYLSQQNLRKVAGALVNARLDYCNSLLAGADKKVIHALQVVQNNAVRIVAGLSRQDHVSAARKEFHWLPVGHRITHKIGSLTFKCLHNLAPDYLSNSISTHAPSRSLRSEGITRVNPPKFKLATFGGRTFAAQAAKIWNSLPPELKVVKHLETFKKCLKTSLFDEIT